MNDLFASIEEAKDERQAIQMADGITTTADDLHDDFRKEWAKRREVA